jgi:hypothetical protein
LAGEYQDPGIRKICGIAVAKICCYLAVLPEYRLVDIRHKAIRFTQQRSTSDSLDQSLGEPA